jgi:hypothetical protein
MRIVHLLGWVLVGGGALLVALVVLLLVLDLVVPARPWRGRE